MGIVPPLLNIPMMAEQQAIKNYIRENGKEPESVKAAFDWQRQWVIELIEH